MNLLTRFGLERSRFTITIMASLLALGFALYPGFPKREDPVVVIRTAVVTSSFSGMAPERIENLVAVPIERKIRELAEVKDIRTLATEGSLIIYVDLKDEVAGVNAAWQRLRDKMNDVKGELPEGTAGPLVNSDFGDVSVATVEITAEGFSYRDLKEVAEDFRKKLYQLAGVAKVELLGAQEERVWLEIDMKKLASVGVQLNLLVKDLQAQNVILPVRKHQCGRHTRPSANIGRFSKCPRHRNDADAGRNDRQPGAACRSRDGSPGLRRA